MPKEMNFSLSGRIVVKKNHKRIVQTRGGRSFLISGKAYEAFREDCLWQLKVIPKVFFDKPVFVEYKFFLKGKLDADTDNLEASINDIMQEARILMDDRLIVEHHTIKIPGNKFFTTEIRIIELE